MIVLKIWHMGQNTYTMTNLHNKQKLLEDIRSCQTHKNNNDICLHIFSTQLLTLKIYDSYEFKAEMVPFGLDKMVPV